MIQILDEVVSWRKSVFQMIASAGLKILFESPIMMEGAQTISSQERSSAIPTARTRTLPL